MDYRLQLENKLDRKRLLRFCEENDIRTEESTTPLELFVVDVDPTNLCRMHRLVGERLVPYRQTKKTTDSIS